MNSEIERERERERETKRERERERERFEMFPAVVQWGFMGSIYRAYSSPRPFI